VGLSNKSLWGDLLGLSREDRQNATQVATALLARRGVAVHRVHEVDQTRQTLTVVREIG
jgi:dihydropteroate synthase